MHLQLNYNVKGMHAYSGEFVDAGVLQSHTYILRWFLHWKYSKYTWKKEQHFQDVV